MMSTDRTVKLIRARSKRQKLLVGIITLLVSILAIVVLLAAPPFVDTVNDMTRADLSQHVSNKSCGPSIGWCPGELECHQGPFNPDGTNYPVNRVGANISESRCVTPTFTERYCGIYEGVWKTDIYPKHIGPCSDRDSSISERVMALVEEGNIVSRIFFTDRNGAEKIRSHGLKLAKESE